MKQSSSWLCGCTPRPAITAEYLRRHGPFEPHRLSLEEMEYTTMSQTMKRLKGRLEPLPDPYIVDPEPVHVP